MIARMISFAVAIAALLAGLSPARAADDASIDALVEADWIDRDQPAAAQRSPAFSLAITRAVLAQAKVLAGRLRPTADAAKLEALTAELEKQNRNLNALETAGQVPAEFRRKGYLAACRTARQIAFCNPLVAGIDRLLLVKRCHPGGVFHMCDQFYGFNARPGGGLFVLEGPLGDHPRLVDLLADSVVESGRLKGRKLAGGSFLSPEVSYDGRTVFFAYSECQGKDLEWSPTSSYHLFRVGADGTGLVQLTDGPCDDFDPCCLPGGRVAFISERRGGYLRCGRHCPTYTLFSMAADGSDIRCLSYHETHEWQPSVDHDGMIVYTRWDYVDRDSDIAHHLWTCYPDGRDPRSLHGNYPLRRESRPWIEQGIRAIPGSQKYVATAAAHHGHALGSLVLIDVRVPDDNAFSQLTRLTPEVPLPESEGRKIADCMVYGAAWPLSENDYLCMYDRRAKNHGIYWIDRFGNKELIYRDPAIPCFSPMPLRSRPVPPVLPDETAADPSVGRDGRSATITLMNVYQSDFSWPPGTQIKSLRIIQILPKSTPPPNEPRIGVADQTNARAVLGTVPVESDGSACFEAPPGKVIYFQALDARGMAVQSMRSVTYVHAGEHLACQGCHEPKHRTPPAANGVRLALQRGPSRIAPEADGSNPFNYVRLVQPVLDRNCATCHQERKALDLSGLPSKKDAHGWTQSYVNLAPRYGFYYNVSNGAIKDPVHGGSRSVAGRLGARAAPLTKYLGPEHYGVKLSDDDFRRITLWLDANSEFYGAYEETAAQARGEIVRPSLE